MVWRLLSGEIFCFGFNFYYDEHYSPKKGEIPGYIELSSYSRMNGNLVSKSKQLLRVEVKCFVELSICIVFSLITIV